MGQSHGYPGVLTIHGRSSRPTRCTQLAAQPCAGRPNQPPEHVPGQLDRPNAGQPEGLDGACGLQHGPVLEALRTAPPQALDHEDALLELALLLCQQGRGCQDSGCDLASQDWIHIPCQGLSPQALEAKRMISAWAPVSRPGAVKSHAVTWHLRTGSAYHAKGCPSQALGAKTTKNFRMGSCQQARSCHESCCGSAPLAWSLHTRSGWLCSDVERM